MSSKPRKAFDGIGRPAGIVDDIFGPLGKKVVKNVRKEFKIAIRSNRGIPTDYRDADIRALDAEDNITEAFKKVYGKKGSTAMNMQNKAYDEEERRFVKRLEKKANATKSTKIKTPPKKVAKPKSGNGISKEYKDYVLRNSRGDY